MNRLKRKAIVDFVSASAFAWIMIAASVYLGLKDVSAAPVRAGILGGAIAGGVGSYLFVRRSKQSIADSFDERELAIIKKAYEWFGGVFIFYLLALHLAALAVTVMKGTIPIWIASVLLFAGLYLGNCVACAVLMRYAREDDE